MLISLESLIFVSEAESTALGLSREELAGSNICMHCSLDNHSEKRQFVRRTSGNIRHLALGNVSRVAGTSEESVNIS